MMGTSDNCYEVQAQIKNAKEKCQNAFQHEAESLGLLSMESSQLNVDRILDLFDKNRDNLDYFIGLWNFVTRDENFTSGIEKRKDVSRKCSCDPRDTRKTLNIKDWSPGVIFCHVDNDGEGCQCDDGAGGGDAEMSAGSYAVKQTVLGGGGEHCNDAMAGEDAMKRFPCGVHGCGQILTSLANYECHYHHCHNYVCDTCRRVFVSSFLLDVHLQENHDSYFAILSQRVDMYRCLVESCDQKFRIPELRKDHLVSIHKFPSNFSFHQPVKSNRSNVFHDSSKSSNTTRTTSTPNLVEMERENDKMETTTSTGDEAGAKEKKNRHQSKPTRVPTSICFGRGSQRAFSQRRGRGRGSKAGNWFQQSSKRGNAGEGHSCPSDAMQAAIDIQTVDMKDLGDALDSSSPTHAS